ASLQPRLCLRSAAQSDPDQVIDAAKGEDIPRISFTLKRRLVALAVSMFEILLIDVI
ncbi:Hypothetical protein SMAX5B_003303, partial [Scophthalmus maximus]